MARLDANNKRELTVFKRGCKKYGFPLIKVVKNYTRAYSGFINYKAYLTKEGNRTKVYK